MPTDNPTDEALRAANRLASGQWTRASDTTVARHIDAGLCLPELLAVEKAVRRIRKSAAFHILIQYPSVAATLSAVAALDAAREKRDG